MKRIRDLLFRAIPVVALALLLFKHDTMSDDVFRMIVFFFVVFTAFRLHFLEAKVMRLRLRLLKAEGKVSPSGSDLLARLHLLIEDGKEIDAMRLYQQETGVSLRDAHREITELSQRATG